MKFIHAVVEADGHPSALGRVEADLELTGHLENMVTFSGSYDKWGGGRLNVKFMRAPMLFFTVLITCLSTATFAQDAKPDKELRTKEEKVEASTSPPRTVNQLSLGVRLWTLH